MKLLTIIVMSFFAFVIVIPSNFVYSLKSELHYSNDLLEHPVVVPPNMRNNLDRATTVTFPDPKKTAILLCDYFYQLEAHNCQEGIIGDRMIRKLVVDFMATTKPKHKLSPEGIKKEEGHLNSTFNSIRNALDTLEASKCAAFLKADAKRQSRQIFMLGMRQKLALEFLKQMNKFVIQETLGDQLLKAESGRKHKTKKQKKQKNNKN